MTATSVLIVEDERSQRYMLEALITKRFGYNVTEAENGEEALALIKKNEFDVVIMDLYMPKKDGLETLKEIAENYPRLPVIMLSGSEDLSHAVDAMKKGAIDFISKPADPERLSIAIYHALKVRSMSQELDRFKRDAAGDMHFDDMIGSKGGLKNLVKLAKKATGSDISVMITGETGVGKEVLARAIHGESLRTGAPFVAINCAAIPEQLVESTLFGHEKGSFTGAVATTLGKFREANGGTIFLDEVGELPADTQAKLLRVLQEREVEPVGAGKSVPVDVRIIAATHRNLKQEVIGGRFREDLFFRLNVLPLHIPPLRERAQDIEPLTHFFMDRFLAYHNMQPKEISSQALTFLASQQWKGNIRELENTIHRIIVIADNQMISLEDVQSLLFTHDSQDTEIETNNSSSAINLVNKDGCLRTLDELEQAAIQFALYYHSNNITKTAQSLGMAKPTLYRRLKAHKITA